MMDTINGRYPLQQDQYSPHIKRVLKSFRSSAMDSLSGPRDFTHFMCEAKGDDDDCLKSKVASYGLPTPITLLQVPKTVDKRAYEQTPEVSETKTGSETESTSPCPPRIPFPPPILSAPDQVWGEVCETILEGETISCFSVGGEKRLCLPQVLNSVLRGVSISQIHGVCDELHIFCSTCSKEQLDVLKKSGILPPSASQCGLITKTDAERLCSELLNNSAPQLLKTEYDSSNLKHRMDVHHKCFGKCRGTLRPDLYYARPSRCIECHECHGLFAPIKFVSHSHDNRETRTVHWGFDSSMWRNYLLLCPGQPDLERKEVLFKEFKDKFDSTLKRKKLSPAASEQQHEKRSRAADGATAATATAAPSALAAAPAAAPSGGGLLYPGGFLDPALLYRYYSAGWPYVAAAASLPRLVPPAAAAAAAAPTTQQQAAPAHANSKPRSFLSHAPPVLLHPDRVVRTEEANQHERHFQPNVALKPQPPPPPPSSTPPHSQKSPTTGAAKPRSPEVLFTGPGCPEVLADVEAAAERVAPLLEPMPAADRASVLEVVRTLADEVVRLRAENKQKTTLLEERSAHLRDLMISRQNEVARQAVARDAQRSACADKSAAALDCRKLSNNSSSSGGGGGGGSPPSSPPVLTNGVAAAASAAAAGAATASRPSPTNSTAAAAATADSSATVAD